MRRDNRSIAMLALGFSAACMLMAPAQASGLLIAEGGLGGQLEIVEQNTNVTINNGIAVTHVEQTFLNKENRIVEALYTFPVPNGASVSNFSMIIGGKEVIGEVVEKERARKIYDSYKRVRRDPGLLEQVDFKTFELRVFPIAAGAEQHISITYYQKLDFDHNQATYVYPLATNTADIVDAKTHGRFAFTIDVKSQIPIVNMSSPSHEDDFVFSQPNPNYRRASLEVVEGDLNRDVVVTLDVERPHTGIDVLTSKTSDEDGYFMLSMVAGEELAEMATGMDYLFVIDVSGSMADDGKLGLSRQAVMSFIGELGPDDRFDVMTFNTVPTLQFGSLTQVSTDTEQNSREFLLSQRAKGGTELRPAINTAYKYKDADRPLNVVILSDGMTEVQEQSELLQAIQSAPSGTRVFCIGIGNEINRPLLKQVAENAGGLAAFISHQDDFARQAQAFRRKLMRPVATNVQINIQGVGAKDFASEFTPDLYYGAPIWLLGRYTTAGTARIEVTAEVLGQPFEQSIEVEFPQRADENPEIERMWAYQRVQSLMNELRARPGDSQQKIDAIVQLCEGYSIVSEYASFIVLENDEEYKRWSIARRNANRIERDRAAQAKLRGELQRLRDDSLAGLGPNKSNLVSTKSEPDSNQRQTAGDPTSAQRVAAQPSQPGDLSLPTFEGGGRTGGGGAIDPVTGIVALGAAGAAALAHRRRRSKAA